MTLVTTHLLVITKFWWPQMSAFPHVFYYFFDYAQKRGGEKPIHPVVLHCSFSLWALFTTGALTAICSCLFHRLVQIS